MKFGILTRSFKTTTLFFNMSIIKFFDEKDFWIVTFYDVCKAIDKTKDLGFNIIIIKVIKIGNYRVVVSLDQIYGQLPFYVIYIEKNNIKVFIGNMGYDMHSDGIREFEHLIMVNHELHRLLKCKELYK